MMMVKHDQRAGLWGDLPFGAMQGRAEECMDQFDQRRGLHHGIQVLKHHRLKRCKLRRKEAFGNIQPLLVLVWMVALVLSLRLLGEMLVVPR
jgi:hypothetical protein